MRQADMTHGFEHISGPAFHVIDRVAEAVIRRAVDEGDTAKAERLRRHWRGSKEGRIDAP